MLNNRLSLFNACFMAMIILLAPTASAADKNMKPGPFKAFMQEKIKTINPNIKVMSVSESGIPGYYQVAFERSGSVYASKDGRHFFEGTLYDMSGPSIVNVTEQAKTQARLALINEFNPAEMIVFSPKAPMKAKAHINVYTDVDCFYCQKLHQDVPEMNAMGIEVRYLAYPRAGIGSPSYDKIVSAWCADDPQDALTRLKNRQSIPPKTCDNPVQKQYELGRRMGVSGTPAIVLEDGTMIPGYKPAAEMAKILGL